MPKYETTLKLHIEPFEAESREQADEIINNYIDIIAQNEELIWGSCDWELEESPNA
jgi:hypothetical protein